MIRPAAAPFGFKAGGMESSIQKAVREQLGTAWNSTVTQWCSEQSASVLSSRPAFRAGFTMPPTVADPLFALPEHPGGVVRVLATLH